jgi:alpha-amylase
MSAGTDVFVARKGGRVRFAAALTAAALMAVLPLPAHAYEVSAPAFLQDFESSWQVISNRTPDIFAAGYGSVYTPPPGRAESGNQSVGYDVFNRYDFGSPGNPTLYGTQTGLQDMINSIHAMGGSSYIDLVWNQSGFADTSTSGFTAGGGYPGFALTLQTSNSSAYGYNTQGYNVTDGDYHSAYATGDQEERLAGLVDIAQESNNVFIRQPTVAGSDNIPGPTGTTGWNGFPLANVPSAANAQYYPQPGYKQQTFYDGELNETFTRSSFNTASPMNGVPTAENALGYLQRYAQYMVQVMGADGFRVDAAKNMPEWVMDYLDVATYDASNRYLLNGQRENIFSFSEVYDSSDSLLDSYVDKSIYSGGVANRDVEDYPLYFAMDSNLSSTTSNNNWYNVVSASVDCYDASNGKQDLTPSGNTGVKFVSNQDVGPPSLDSVAYAYILMMPGNAMVYYNGHNFGTESQRTFPNDGREDALGGAYGTALTTLVDLRNRYGRGDYRQDWLDTANYAYERTGSCLVMLSNNTNPGYDSITIPVTFAPGTPLVELTGNAASTVADPTGVIAKFLVVQSGGPLTKSGGGEVNANFLRNATSTTTNGTTVTTQTGDGYLIYGLATPTGTLGLSNVASIIHGVTPNSSDSNIAYENGTDTTSNVDVIKASTFTLTLNTTENNIVGYGHDHDADGDSGYLKIDGGIDVTGNGLDTNPSDVTYGYEAFATVNQTGYAANNGAGGNGTYEQIINTSSLSQGYHYITAISFRHNDNTSAPPVYNDWKQTIYVDTAPPNSTIASFNPTSSNAQNRTLVVQSVDQLANNTHVFLDLPFGLTTAQVLAMVGSNNQPTQTDVNLWSKNYSGVISGNHTATIVSYKPDGTTGVQRYSENQLAFLGVNTGLGAGIGDLNADGSITSTDINSLGTLVQTNNQSFSAAADVNGDGLVNLSDVFLMGPVLSAANVTSATYSSYQSLIAASYVTGGTYNVVENDNIYLDTAAATVVPANTMLIATAINNGAAATLNIAAGAQVVMRSNGTLTGVPAALATGTSRLTGLTIASANNAWTGTLNLNNNDLVFESTAANAATDLGRLTSQLASGFNNGAWNGTGIDSAAAASDNTRLHALGIIQNIKSDGTALYNSFDGQSVDTNSLLIKYTYYGDALLQGTVTTQDYLIIDNGYHLGLSGWQNGDFNYDGVINGDDYSLLDNAYNMLNGLYAAEGLASSTATPAELLLATPAEQIATPSAVPEPASAAIVLLGSAGLLSRRTRLAGTRRNHASF